MHACMHACMKACLKAGMHVSLQTCMHACMHDSKHTDMLFLLYTADIPLIAGQFGLGVHCYADDGQLYIFDRAGHSDRLVSKVTVCRD